MSEMKIDEVYKKAKAMLPKGVKLEIQQSAGDVVGWRWCAWIGEGVRELVASDTTEALLPKLAEWKDTSAERKAERIKELEHELAELKGK